jgi:hypothetical protein
MTEATIGINVPTDIRRIPALAKAIVRFLDIHRNKPARDAPLLVGGVGVTVRRMSDGELTRLEVLRDLDQRRLKRPRRRRSCWGSSAVRCSGC